MIAHHCAPQFELFMSQVRSKGSWSHQRQLLQLFDQRSALKTCCSSQPKAWKDE